MPSIWVQFGETQRHVVSGHIIVLGFWRPLAHCVFDLVHGLRGIPLVNQGGHGPKGDGGPVGHHPHDFSSSSVILVEIVQGVDICCGTHLATGLEIKSGHHVGDPWATTETKAI